MKLDPKEVIKAMTKPVADYLAARAIAEVERERVDKIQRRVLAESVFMANTHGRDGGGRAFRVTEPKDSYLMRDEDAARYFDTLNAIHLAEGFKDAEKGYCPALTSEHNQTKAEWALIEASRAFFPEVTNDKLLGAGGCEMRRKYIDLIVGLVLAAPKKVA